MDVESWVDLVESLTTPVLLWRTKEHDNGRLRLAYANAAATNALRIDLDRSLNRSFDELMPDDTVMPRVGAVRDAVLSTFLSGEVGSVRGVSIGFSRSAADCFHFTFKRVSGADVAMIGEAPHKGFIENSLDVFGAMAPDGHTIYRTPSAETIFGYAPGDLGDRIEDLDLAQPGKSALLEARDYLLTGPHVSRTVEFRRRDRDGNWHDMELIARDFIEHPDVGGIVFNSRDISQRKADERKIRALNEDLESFTYTVSHDLRLPLRIVKELLIRAVSDGENIFSPHTLDNLSRIATLVEDMTTLIQDLLAFSRVGAQPLVKSRVDISALSRELQGDLNWTEGMAPGTVQIEDGIHCYGDPALLRQVLLNLLSNAVKFSSRVAEPRVYLGQLRGAAGCGFYVRDNGIGFEPDRAPELFTVFRRLHQDPSIPGTGVGLAIVKRIMEHHGGRVWAEGASGAGATLYCELPPGPAEN